MDGRIRRRLAVPDISKDEWSDFRRDYESGMSLALIGEKYCCDRRTVRAAILHNHSSDEIGKRKKPVLTDGYEQRIEKLWQINSIKSSLLATSKDITEKLKSEGYSGSERTIRNYLKHQPYVLAYLQEDE